MSLKLFALGVLVKAISGLDDTVTRVPMLAALTRTRAGRIAFSIGTLGAVSVATIVAILFAAAIQSFPYYREVSALLIFGVAIAVYFDIFTKKPKEKAEEITKKKLSRERFTHLVIAGFIISLVTVIDDAIVYSPLFLAPISDWIFALAGIIFATLIQIAIAIRFSEELARLPRKKLIASAGLAILGVLVLFRVI